VTDTLAGLLALAVVTQAAAGLLVGRPAGGAALLRWTGRRLGLPVPGGDVEALTRRLASRERAGALGAVFATAITTAIYLRHLDLLHHHRHPYNALWLVIPWTGFVAGRMLGQYTASADETRQAQPPDGPGRLADHLTTADIVAARLLLLVAVPGTAVAMYLHQSGHHRNLSTSVARALVIPLAVGLLAAIELTAQRLAGLPRSTLWDRALFSLDLRQVYALGCGVGLGLTTVLAAGLGLPEAVQAPALYVVLATVLLLSVAGRPASAWQRAAIQPTEATSPR
jgi:hypothetical protein